MSQQPESTLPSSPTETASMPGIARRSGVTSGVESRAAQPSAPGREGAVAKHPPPQHIPGWIERVEPFLRVLLRMYIGVAVCYAPWSRLFWDRNPLFVLFPTLSIYAANGAVRGIVSGLGLLNLWIAFQDAIRRRDG
jgi:hypothetical protein